MAAPSSRRRAAPFVAASILCLVAGCSSLRASEQAAAREGAVVALNDAQLGSIRGGFDVSPNLTVNFGFQQVTSVNQNIVSSVVVPDITISPASRGTRFSSLSAFGNVVSRPDKDAAAGGSASPQQTAIPVVVAGGTGQPQSVTSGIRNSVLTSTQGQGATTVLTQLGSGGFATIIGNTTNNALVQNMTTINLAISGLGALLAQGRSNAALVNALSLGSAQFR